MKKYNMDQFFNWLAKPMEYEEIDAWYKANNIIPELSDLFRDFCFSLLNLVQDTYLGDISNNNKETNIGLTLEDKVSHFDWCWKKTVDNFSKENVFFVKTDESYDYFKNFFMDVFYNQEQEVVKNSLNDFFNSYTYETSSLVSFISTLMTWWPWRFSFFMCFSTYEIKSLE